MTCKTQIPLHGVQPETWIQRFIEAHPRLIHAIRSFTEQNFIVKKRALLTELDLQGWILDIACGKGFILDVVSSAKYLGVDYSEKVLRYAKSLHQKTFIAMDGRALGFHDQSFRNCIAMDVFHHIPDEDFDCFLQEIRRVMKDDGLFLVTDPVKAKLSRDPLSCFFQRFDGGDSFRDPEELIRFLLKYFKIKKQYFDKSGIGTWQIYVLAKS